MNSLKTTLRPTQKALSLLTSRTTRYNMSSTNDYGQGASHAKGDSVVPNKVQEAAPEGLERNLPESVRLFLSSNIPSDIFILTDVSSFLGPPHR